MRMLLTEANYQEFRKRYEEGRPFALISAFQGGLDASTNKNNNVVLRKKIQQQGYDCLRVMGSYKEADDYYENMIVFCDKAENYTEFVRFLLFFGKRYNQNSVIIIDPDKNIWEYATRTDSTVGGVGSKKRYDKYMNASTTELDALIERFTRRTYELDNIRLVND